MKLIDKFNETEFEDTVAYGFWRVDCTNCILSQVLNDQLSDNRELDRYFNSADSERVLQVIDSYDKHFFELTRRREGLIDSEHAATKFAELLRIYAPNVEFVEQPAQAGLSV